MERMPTPQENMEGEVNPQEIAQAVTVESKWMRVLKNEDVHKGVAALARTVANATISAVDVIPGAGEVASWGADAWKFVAPKLKVLGLPNFELTPSVSKFEAISTEMAEAISLGTVPSHLYETIQQLRREDIGKLKQAYRTVKEIMSSEQAHYQANKAQYDEAIAAFKQDHHD